MKRYLTAFIILAGMVILSAGCASDPYQKGFKAYRSGDYATAMQELSTLAERGDADAQLHLGLMYRDGQGVLPNPREAEKWLQRSAEQENVTARIALASLYADRQGLIRDDVKALMWFNFAVVQGSNEAVPLRDSLLLRMTPAQVVEAQRLGREFKSEKDYKDMVRDLKPQADSGDAAALMKIYPRFGQGRGQGDDRAGPSDGLDVSRSGRRGPASGARIQDCGEMRPARWVVCAKEEGGYLQEERIFPATATAVRILTPAPKPFRITS
ncbi:MAG: tetratricopeptide repeat protein [Candidatus Aminicenantes bacterium]|nr:tetratricopeptide repeat protein [Candidatus Aminicenantes bacterium]